MQPAHAAGYSDFQKYLRIDPMVYILQHTVYTVLVMCCVLAASKARSAPVYRDCQEQPQRAHPSTLSPSSQLGFFHPYCIDKLP